MMAQFLQLMEQTKIVHGNLRPQNIIIQQTGNKITGVKVKGFNYSVNFNKVQNMGTVSAEYKAPEILKFLMHDKPIKMP